ncbi:unnamed protein product [Alopecurus aequalis]
MAAMQEDPPAPELVNVVVQWCGINYDVSVPPEARIVDLKRRTCEEAGIPAKRQRYTESDMVRWDEVYELNDDIDVASLQDPPTTNLVGLNENIGVQIYKKHYDDIKKPICRVEATKERLVDFDGSRKRLYRATYNVGTMTIGCRIKYYQAGDRADLFRSVQLMRGWNHSNLVTMENLYSHRGNLPRLLLSNTINGTFEGYMKDKAILNSDGTLTNFFTGIIQNLCGVLDQMVKRKLCPNNLTKDKLYFQMVKDEPQLKILFDNVDLLKRCTKDFKLKNLCKDLEVICTPNEPALMDAGTKDFLNFLGNEADKFIGKNLAKTAKHYPTNWTEVEKSKFLIDLIPSSNDVFAKINGCGISWPKGETEDEMSDELKQLKTLVDAENEVRRNDNLLIQEENKKIKEDNEAIEAGNKNLPPEQAKKKKLYRNLRVDINWNYNIKFPHHLVRLTRNMWKHFDTLPRSIQRFFGSRAGTLATLERWCPNVWVLTYNAVGLGN